MTKLRTLAFLTGIFCAVLFIADSARADAPGFFKQPKNPTTQNGTGDLSIQAIASATTSFPLTFYWYKNSALINTWTTNGNLGCTYVISNAVPTNSGNYQIILSNSLGTATSAVFTVTINNPYFAVSPNSLSAPEGSSTNLTSLALGTSPIDYYWYKRIAGVSTNVVSTGSSNLVFAPLVRTNGGIYFVVASNTWGAVTSSTVTLTVNYKPAITNISSTNIVAEINSSAYSAVQYTASPNPSLYWFKDDVYQPSLFGSSSLSLYSVQTTNSGSYQLVVSNFLGSVTSAPIVLTVLPARGPTITNQPVDRVVAVNGMLSLNVLADGSPTMYSGLFKEGGGQLGSWTYGLYLTATVTNTSQSGNYYIVVTNNYGSATSELASVTVIEPQPASVVGRQFIKIADSTLQAPGFGSNFHNFSDAFIKNGEVWFGAGVGSVSFPCGIYHWSNNVIESLVDTNSSIPGGSGTFANFYGSAYLSDGKVIFAGRGSGNQGGIYAWTNGTIIRLYDTNTVMPGQSFTFENFGWPTVISNQFAFLGIQTFGGKNEYRAVYISSNNVLTKLADTNDILPDAGHFRGSSSQVAFDGDKVAWWGIGETGQGIYTVSRTAPIAAVATTSTFNPASGVNFTGFTSPPDSVPGITYFSGYSDSFYTSLFSYNSGGLHLVAKPGDLMPGRGVPFRYVGPGFAASTTGGYYSGLDSSGFGGIYYWDGTNSTKVIDSLDTLDGLAIQYAYIAAADQDSIVIYIGFQNGTQALYALTPATGQSFSQWAANYNIPSGHNNPQDDADGDGVPNIFEYYFGTNPTNSASGAQPTETRTNVGGVDYPAITFVRSQSVSGVTLIPQVSSSVLFADSLGSTVESVVDLGNGTERVTIRSNVSIAAQTTQFLRIGLTVP